MFLVVLEERTFSPLYPFRLYNENVKSAQQRRLRLKERGSVIRYGCSQVRDEDLFSAFCFPFFFSVLFSFLWFYWRGRLFFFYCTSCALPCTFFFSSRLSFCGVCACLREAVVLPNIYVFFYYYYLLFCPRWLFSSLVLVCIVVGVFSYRMFLEHLFPYQLFFVTLYECM